MGKKYSYRQYRKIRDKQQRLVDRSLKDITPEEFRVLQRIQNRIHDDEALKHEVNLTKLVVQSSGRDYDKVQCVLQVCQIPYQATDLVVHPKYPMMTKGVSVIAFSIEDGPLTLHFDIIFNSSNGKFVSFAYKISGEIP